MSGHSCERISVKKFSAAITIYLPWSRPIAPILISTSYPLNETVSVYSIGTSLVTMQTSQRYRRSI